MKLTGCKKTKKLLNNDIFVHLYLNYNCFIKDIHQNIGKLGEELATTFLEDAGYSILEQNYRHKRGEIDIIVSKEDIVIFVEVKTRSSIKFGFPEDFVDTKKQRQIIATAEAYLEEKQHHGEIRFDIVSIEILNNNSPQILHIKDAFFPID